MKKIIYITTLLFTFCTAWAQPASSFIFTHLTTQDGLSNNNVDDITQDSSGFIWIATSDGLNRYDGKHFKIYRHNPLNPNSLPNSTVVGLAIEKNGLIWIGTNDGLCSLDPKTDSFCIYKNLSGSASSLGHNYRPKPFIDRNDDLWVGTLNGLDYFDKKNKIFIHCPLPTSNKTQIPFGVRSIGRILEDNYQHLWCLNLNYLFLFDRKTRKFTRYGIADYPEPNFFDLAQKNDTALYVSHWSHGLSEFNVTKGKFTPVPLKSASPIILSLQDYTIQGKKLFLAGTDQELLLFDPQYSLSNPIIFKHNVLIPSSIIGNRINNIFRDRQNIIWVSTHKGISQLNPQVQLFQNPGLGSSLFPEEPEKFGEPGAFYEDDDHYWLGVMYNAGIYQYDKEWRLTKRILSIPPRFSGGRSRNIFQIYKENGITWFSTDSGLVKYSNDTKQYDVFVPYNLETGNGQELQMRKVVPYQNEWFFVRTWNWGVYLFNKKTETYIKHYMNVPGDSKSLAENNVLDIVKNNRGEIYVSTANGLCRYDPASNNFTTFRPSPLVAGIGNFLGKMTTDDSGNLWITSVQGLFHFNTLSNQFIRYTTADGLSSDQSSRVCMDNEGKIWITTPIGISHYDPVKKQFLNFSTREGLPANDFDGLLTKASNGNIVAGYVGGVVVIDPRHFPFNHDTPPVTFAEIKVQDKPFAWHQNEQGNKEIRLKYSQNVLNIAFAVLNFTSSYQNKYYYKLEGFDADWRQSPDGNITYTNLSPREYLLRVKGSNNSAVMNEKGDSLLIFISPPFWQTWGFRAWILLSVAGLTYWLVRKRIHAIRKEEQLKQQRMEAEMTALRAQMNPHFIFNCLNSIDNLIQTDQKEKATTYLAKFAKLIRAILENSKQDTIPCWKDLETLKLYLELEEFRWDKKFFYQLNIATSIMQGDYKVPPMVIQPFVENAIHHGLLNKETGEKKLTLDVNVDNNWIRYTVEDNGVGRIKAEEYKKLNKPSHQSLGMQITRDRINLFNQKNNGTIKITDLYDERQQPAGTKVEISLVNQS